jgi:hypothetical protein
MVGEESRSPGSCSFSCVIRARHPITLRLSDSKEARQRISTRCRLLLGDEMTAIQNYFTDLICPGSPGFQRRRGLIGQVPTAPNDHNGTADASSGITIGPVVDDVCVDARAIISATRCDYRWSAERA